MIKKAIIGMIINSVIWIYTFYSSFGFTLVWKYQRIAFFESFAFCFLFNYVICEFLIELFIAILYIPRKQNFFFRAIGEGLNNIRNYRCLSP